MKKTLKSLKFWLILFDISFIPLCIFFRWLSDEMLSHNTVCIWTILGGKCLTCGGTHFVNSLLSGDIIAAYHHNQLLFIAAIFLVITFVLLHFFLFGKSRFAKRILTKIYSIPSILIAAAVTLAFLIIRNIPTFITIYKILKHLILK